MSSVRPVPSGKERGSTLPLPSFKSSHDGRELGFVSTVRARLGSLSRQFALAVAIVVAPVLLGLVVIALLMVVSGHDVAIVAGIVRLRRRAGSDRGRGCWPAASFATSTRSETV